MQSGHRTIAQRRATGTLLGLAAILMWSSLFAVARSVVEQLGPLWSAGLVSLVGGAVGVVVIASRRGRRNVLRGLPRKYLLGCGLLFVTYNAAIYIALATASDRTQSIEVTLVNYLWPAFTLVLSVPLLGHTPRLLLLPGLCMALAGTYLGLSADLSFSLHAMLDHLTRHPTPYALALGAAFCWGLYNNLARRWGNPAGEGAVPFFLLVTGVALIVAARWIDPHRSLALKPHGLAEMLYLALFPTLLAYHFWDTAMRTGNLAVLSSVSFFTPLMATAIGSLYLHVAMGTQFWLACGLVIVGAAMCRYAVIEPHANGQPI